MKRKINVLVVCIVICILLFTVLCIAAKDYDNGSIKQKTLEPDTVYLTPNNMFEKEIGTDQEKTYLKFSQGKSVETNGEFNTTITIRMDTGSMTNLSRAVFSCKGSSSMDGWKLDTKSSLQTTTEKLSEGTTYEWDLQHIRTGTGFLTEFSKQAQTGAQEDYIELTFYLTVFKNGCDLRLNTVLYYDTDEGSVSLNQVTTINVKPS